MQYNTPRAESTKLQLPRCCTGYFVLFSTGSLTKSGQDTVGTRSVYMLYVPLSRRFLSTLYHPYFYPLRNENAKEYEGKRGKQIHILLDKVGYEKMMRDCIKHGLHNSNP